MYVTLIRIPSTVNLVIMMLKKMFYIVLYVKTRICMVNDVIHYIFFQICIKILRNNALTARFGSETRPATLKFEVNNLKLDIENREYYMEDFVPKLLI